MNIMQSLDGFDNDEFRKEMVGLKLTSVVFIWDYVQLVFDGHGEIAPTQTPTLNIYTPTTIHIGKEVFDHKNPLYQNRLCNLIGKKVKYIEIVKKQKIEIAFEDNTKVIISLKPEDYTYGPEAAQFRDEHNGLWIW